MGIDRRAWMAGAVAAVTVPAGVWWHRRQESAFLSELPQSSPDVVRQVGAMPYRRFGSTDLVISEVSFGAWGIGGGSYGRVERAESLRALARAEELGCNLVDTANVYGDSEEVLGVFLRGRRSKWVVSTKYSGQAQGMQATLELQLRRLGVDAVDFYMIHWPPRRNDDLYEQLYAIKASGKARYVGVSLYNVNDIDRVLLHTLADGFMVPFSLLDPDPFLVGLDRIRQARKGVLVRSALKEGFLTGAFRRDATFQDPADQRHTWSPARIATTVDAVERLRFLEYEMGSMVRAAIAYPLSYPEVSSVVLGTRLVAHADSNYGDAPGARLSMANMQRVAQLQRDMGLRGATGLIGRLRRQVAAFRER